MIEITISMSLLTGLSFLLLLASYLSGWRKAKIFFSCIVSDLSLFSMILFCKMQKVHGNPDMGMEFWQWYFPISIYLLLIFFGIISFIITVFFNGK